MKAIVTGATGFVGSHLCKFLIENNWEVTIISRLGSNYSNLNSVYKKIEIFEYDGRVEELIDFFKLQEADVIFHLASLCITEHTYNQVDQLIDSNIKFGIHILEAMKESGIRLIINTGTYWQHYQSNEYNPVDLYAATKQAFQDLIKYYSEAENLRCITLKLFDTYGEYDRRPKLINLLHQFSDERRELKMSPGEQVLDLVHIDDVVRAFLIAYEYLSTNENLKNEVFAVASRRETQLRDLIKLFEEITDKEIKITWGSRPYRKREVMTLWKGYDVLPNWECSISLEEGLKKFERI